MKYQIGQPIWRATWDASGSYVTCPDCGGTGRLRVTFHDETQVSIACANCARGYEPPTGFIHVYDRKAVARLTTITGCEVEGDKVEWRTTDSYRNPESDLFDNEADCLARAAEMAAEADREEREKVNRKHKDTRTWAWNVSYHRNQIKEAQRQIEYHTRALNVAKVRAKEPEPKQSAA